MIPAAIVALMSVGAFFGYTSTPDEDLSDLQLANAEALADNDELDPCVTYSFGFRQWALSGFLERKQAFYDCCGVIREGYDPKGSCL